MSDTGSRETTAGRLIAVELDEASIRRSSPDVEHERAAAIYDLLEDNGFSPVGHPPGTYRLRLSIREGRLVFAVSDADDREVVTHILSLSPLRKVMRDYFLVCDSYYAAIRSSTPQQIEAIDMGRRGLHDEGAAILRQRLEGKISVDSETARRLFTLICALQRNA
ncbi:MAG: UPF0262 family protein [Bauldia sp.]|nr:UPF0262 family protein [Bauldia sp.]